MSKFNKGELAVYYILDHSTMRVIGQEIVTVTDIYSDMESRFGPYPELYEITRSDGLVVRGLLPHALNRM